VIGVDAAAKSLVTKGKRRNKNMLCVVTQRKRKAIKGWPGKNDGVVFSIV